jgi:hypothetical protein
MTIMEATPRHIEVWRLEAETAMRFGGVLLGQFNWPMVVLSLIAAVEKDRGP